MAGPAMDDREAKLELYKKLLLKWGDKVNLVGPEARQNLDEHIAEALEAGTHLPLAGEALDFGSGGGLPGIPLAIAGGSAVRFHMVEADQKKWAFLKAAVRECGLNCRVYGDRLESVVPQLESSLLFDLVTSRAVGYPERWVPLVMPRLKPGGRIGLFQSSPDAPEIPGVQLAGVHQLSRGDSNYLVVMEMFHVEQHG